MAPLVRSLAMAAAAGLMLPQGVAGGAVELGESDFEKKVFGEGKNAFVKFFAPWCGHCKALAPAWNKLGDAFADSTSVIVGDVDCTSDEGKKVCNDFGVQGYPTVKYFTAETGKKGEDYSGGRTFEDLEKFTKETLAKKCDVKTKEDCTDEEKKYIDKMSAKDSAAIEKEGARLKGMTGSSMKDDKRKWLMQRIAILDGLAGAKSEL